MSDASQSRSFSLDPGRNCWRVARAGRAALIVDAADYFRLARQAMMEAREQILLVGWDVDTRISMHPKEPGDGAPTALGPFVTWLAKRRPELNIHMLPWDGQAWKLFGRGTTFLRLARWWMTKRIRFRLDHKHPVEASHHHKILVIDDCIAFCGGIDMTGSRWDTRGHCDDEPGRRRPTTRRRYGPWHDATMAVDGDVATALGELARKKWRDACGEELPCSTVEEDRWPEELEPNFRDVDVAIARTRGEVDDIEEVREVEALFVDMIEAATRSVYVEAQYFASRVVAEAIARRLEEPHGPEFVVVNPKSADGWLEEQVMGGARARLLQALSGKPGSERFRIYTPVTQGGDDIYVHAKIMIVDDRMLRVGSANLNNRSMGLDSECDLMIDAQRSGGKKASEAIARIRCDLLAEHLGVTAETVERALADTGTVIGAIERLRGRGRTLMPFVPEEPGALQKKIADSEALDPEAADELFEPTARRHLLGALRRG